MNLSQLLCERPHKRIYRDGDKIIKVFEASYSKADVLNEALNTARVEQEGLNTPCLHAVTVVDGSWAVISDFIDGKTMLQLMEENPQRLEELMDRFIDIQLQILSHTCPMLNDLSEKLQKRISLSRLDASTRYDLHNRLGSMRSHHKLCHGDYNPSNVIITPDHKVYIIDWSHATQGNASADAAMTYMLFHLQGQPEWAEMYLSAYCKKSDTARQYVKKWLPIVAAAQMSNPNLSDSALQLLRSWALAGE